MILQRINYVDLNGDTQEEIHYFHLSKAEIIELEMTKDGSLSAIMKTMIEKQDATEILPFIKLVVSKAYGTRSVDGKNFIKDPQVTNNFLTSEAFAEFFVGLMQNPERASEFFEGLAPKSLVEQGRESEKATASRPPKAPQDYQRPAQPKPAVEAPTQSVELTAEEREKYDAWIASQQKPTASAD